MLFSPLSLPSFFWVVELRDFFFKFSDAVAHINSVLKKNRNGCENKTVKYDAGDFFSCYVFGLFSLYPSHMLCVCAEVGRKLVVCYVQLLFFCHVHYSHSVFVCLFPQSRRLSHNKLASNYSVIHDRHSVDVQCVCACVG